MTTIHTHGFLRVNDWRGLQPAIHSGDVPTVASEVMRNIKSFGHVVTTAGGNYTGAHEHPKMLWFRVTLRGESEPSMWHAFTTPGEPWGRQTDDQEISE